MRANVLLLAFFGEVKVIVFPGVGSFGSAMETLNAKGFTEPLSAYIKQDRPFFGICLGMQVTDMIDVTAAVAHVW